MIARLDPPDSPGEDYYLPAAKLRSGNPRQTVWTQYTDASGRFCVGWWRSEPGKWAIAYTEEEYCQLLTGSSRLEGDDGTVLLVSAGDSFVIPRGFTGTWEVIDTTTKRFVIFEDLA